MRRSTSDGERASPRHDKPSGKWLSGPSGEVVLSVRDVTVEFSGKKVLDKLSLDVMRGEILGFVGASGAGKSVLLRTILGLNRKQSGTIKLFGIDLDKASESRKDAARHAFRRAVPAWRAVFGADRAGERAGADARISRPAARS